MKYLVTYKYLFETFVDADSEEEAIHIAKESENWRLASEDDIYKLDKDFKAIQFN